MIEVRQTAVFGAYTRRGSELVNLLGGGDKSGQSRDIRDAQRLAEVME